MVAVMDVPVARLVAVMIAVRVFMTATASLPVLKNIFINL
jgi:hypothetical protein